MTKKNKVFTTLVLSMSLLFQGVLFGWDPCANGSMHFNTGPRDPIGCCLLMFTGLAGGIAAMSVGTVGYVAAAAKLDTMFGGDLGIKLGGVSWLKTPVGEVTEKMSRASLVSPGVLSIAGIFGAFGVYDFLNSAFSGDSAGVLKNAAVIGASGLAALANVFMINQEVTKAFVNANLLSAGMISGITVGTGLLISKIVDIYKKNEAGRISVEEAENNIKAVIGQTLPDAIEERINKLLSTEVNDTGWIKPISVFPTAKAKIFALKNIEDFFAFPYRSEKTAVARIQAEGLNPFVYKVCMKKINELQATLDVMVDDDGNEVWVDKDKTNRSIDVARDKYLTKFGLSVKSLANMSAAVLDKKIEEVTALANEIKEKKEVPDAEKWAIASILYHLCYKKYDQKAAVLVADSLAEAEKLSGKPAKTDKTLVIDTENARRKAEYIIALRKKQEAERNQWRITKFINRMLGRTQEVEKPKYLPAGKATTKEVPLTNEAQADMERRAGWNVEGDVEFMQKQKESKKAAKSAIAEKSKQGGIVNWFRSWWSGE